jgi:hypothetical protein
MAIIAITTRSSIKVNPTFGLPSNPGKLLSLRIGLGTLVIDAMNGSIR